MFCYVSEATHFLTGPKTGFLWARVKIVAGLFVFEGVLNVQGCFITVTVSKPQSDTLAEIMMLCSNRYVNLGNLFTGPYA